MSNSAHGTGAAHRATKLISQRAHDSRIKRTPMRQIEMMIVISCRLLSHVRKKISHAARSWRNDHSLPRSGRRHRTVIPRNDSRDTDCLHAFKLLKSGPRQSIRRVIDDHRKKSDPRLGGSASRCRLSASRGSPRQGQGGRIRAYLLALWCRLLLYPRHRHLHQARRLSARRHHIQRRRARRPGLERRSRPAEPLPRLLHWPFAYAARDRHAYRHGIRRGPHLRPG